MNEVIEALLVAWGNEVISPALDVSIRSPLGTMDEEGGRSVGGSRCLMTSVEHSLVMSPASQVVQGGLNQLALDEPAGLGSLGRALGMLAVVRYSRRQKLAVVEQCKLLGISQRTYRTRVGDLHLALEDVLPGLVRRRSAVEAGSPSAGAARKRLEQARQAAKDAARAKRQRRADLRAFARAVHQAAVVAAK